MKILVVDDEVLARQRLVALIEEIGQPYQLAGEAANGEEALQKFNQIGVDLVLMDIRMPGMDGLEAARQMAESDHPPAVIFTTAYEEHALQAFESAAQDYLLKPVRRVRLLAALQRSQRLTRSQLAATASTETEVPQLHACTPAVQSCSMNTVMCSVAQCVTSRYRESMLNVSNRMPLRYSLLCVKW